MKFNDRQNEGIARITDGLVIGGIFTFVSYIFERISLSIVELSLLLLIMATLFMTGMFLRR